jgi:DNA modification methylase
MNNTILQGNVLERTKDIESNSIQCCVTSPPYWGLRDYGTATWEGGDENCSHKRDSKASESCTTGHVNLEGSVGDGIYKSVCKRCGAVRVDNQLGLEETPEEYVENMVKVFREVRRVLKDDGTLWLNLGDSYCGTGHKGDSKDPKHSDGRSGQKKAVNNKIQGLKPKDLVGIPWRVALALQADGWYLRQDIIWHKPNPMPEPVTDRCTKAHEYIFLMSKSPKYYYDVDALKEKSTTFENRPSGVARDRLYDYDSKEKAMGKRTGIKFGGNKYGDSDDPKHNTKSGNEYVDNGMRNKRSVWTITTKPYKEAHFAVFPTKLPELCIRAGTKEGDLVLDPFFGSGTTGWVARELGRNYLGIELNPEYIKIAKGRFSQGVLF